VLLNYRRILVIGGAGDISVNNLDLSM